MSSPGYRNTAPVKLYMEFSRDPLDLLEDGILTGIQDPFELKDSFMSFDYALAGKGGAGVFNVKLINPSQAVEEKIFSWYCAINPRTWRASEEATPEEWTFSAGQAATVFLRWGYQNDNIDRDANIKNAFSHVHKTKIIDVQFNISDRKERIITLRLQNQHGIGITRQVAKRRKGETNTYRVKISNDSGMRPPAEIISELLGTLAAGDAIETHVFLSDEHKQTLNEEFDKIHPGANKQIPTPEEKATTSPKDRANPTISKSKQITLDIAKQYFEYLDVNFVADIEKPPEASDPTVPAEKPNKYQNGVAGGQTDALAVDRNKEAAILADKEVFQVFGNLAPFRVLDKNRFHPFANLYPGLLNLQETDIQSYVLVNDDYFNLPLEFTLNELRSIIDSGRVKLLNLPTDPTLQNSVLTAYVNSPSRFDSQTTDTFFREQFLAVESYTEGAPNNFYSLSLNPTLATSLRIFADQMEAKHREIVDKAAELRDALQQGTEDQKVIDENTADEVEKPQEPAKDRSFISVVCSDRYAHLRGFIDGLNETFFDNAGEYIDMRFLDTTVVPKKLRPEVEDVIGKVNWDEADTICMIGTLTKIQRALEFNRDINSFPIQVENRPDVISLATGFNQRKDNIIVSLEHRISKNSFYNTMLTMPTMAPKLYDVIQRFESSGYRDAVSQVFSLGLVTNTTDVFGNPLTGRAGVAAPNLVAPEQHRDGVAISKALKTLDSTISSEAFPARLAEKSISQVSRIVDGLDDEVLDSALSDLSREEIKKQIIEDLTFIRQKGFMDIFFPEISSSYLGSMRQKMYVDGEEITKESSFRYVTNAPLSRLQAKLGVDGSAEEAVVLAAKMRSLFAFKKNVSDIKLKTLGIPEMDILAYETGKRECAIWISEPRVPGTFHWLTGIYTITNVTHSVSVNGGYTSEITLIPTSGNTAEEMLKYNYTFLTNDN